MRALTAPSTGHCRRPGLRTRLSHLMKGRRPLIRLLKVRVPPSPAAPGLSINL